MADDVGVLSIHRTIPRTSKWVSYTVVSREVLERRKIKGVQRSEVKCSKGSRGMEMEYSSKHVLIGSIMQILLPSC